MTLIELIEARNTEEIVFFVLIRAIVILICWFAMALSCIIDFWSGTDTAKALNEPLESRGFRKTITKIGDYARVMLFCLMFDAIGSLLSFYVLPFASMLFTAAVMCIEGKSVMENSARKKAHVADVPEMVKEIVRCANTKDGQALLERITEAIHRAKETEARHE